MLDQLLERQILVGIGAERGRRHLRQELAEGRIGGRQPATQGQGVDEKADQALDVGVVTPRDRRAGDHVAAARDPVQQGAEGGERGHEQGRSRAPTGGPQPRGQLRRQPEDLPPAVKATAARPRPVGGQLQSHGPRQLLPPPGELLVQHLACEPVPLPDGEVGILARQLGQRARCRAGGDGFVPPVGDKRFVQRHDLAQQDAQGPAVGGDVVEAQDQRRPIAGELDEHRPQHRTAAEVERPERLFVDQTPRFGTTHGRRQAPQIDHRQAQTRKRLDDLPRPPVAGRIAGPQHLVTAHDLGQAGLQGADPQRYLPPFLLPSIPRRQGQGPTGEQVVGGAGRRQPVQEPQALLGEGQR